MNKKFNFQNLAEVGEDTVKDVKTGIRAPRAKEPKEKQRQIVSIVPEHLFDRMARAKYNTGVKYKEMIIEALEQWLDKHEKNL